jgi:hypothetical protein
VKKYPSIPKEINKSTHIYAFDKLDGSNIRAEWSSKRGFYKFGTRKRLLDPEDKLFGEAVSIINDKYGETLPEIFKKQRWRKVICFFEFYGPNSFAGTHQQEKHDVVLLDVSHDNKGIIEPKDFIKLFKYVDTAAFLFQGKINNDLINQVKKDKLPGVTSEGVVCKGKIIKPGLPLMFKIKSDSWLNRLKIKCAGNVKLLKELE